MSIATRFGYSFSKETQRRGDQYFRAGKVQLTRVTASAATAKVVGSRRTPYIVAVDYSDRQHLDVQCSCPHFNDGYDCKHIWATLLEIDDQELTVLDGANVLADEGWGDGDSDDQGPFDSLANKAPSWEQALAEIESNAQTSSEVAREILTRDRKQREIWFQVNVADSHARDGLVVDLLHREMKRNGEFGKIKTLRVQLGEMERFSSDDRLLLEMLLGGKSAANRYYGYSYESYSSALVPTAMYEFLLPRICEGNRCVWALDREIAAEQAQRLHYDAGAPWTFRVRIDEDDSSQSWDLVGEFCRGEQLETLADAVLVVPGIAMLPDRFIQVKMSDVDFSWIRMLRALPALTVPYADRSNLLTKLFEQSGLPALSLPDALNVAPVEVAPRGRLEIKSPKNRRFSDQLYAMVGFLYGEHFVPIRDSATGFFDEASEQIILRNHDQEQQLLQKLVELNLRQEKRRSLYSEEDFDVCFPQRELMEIVRVLSEAGWVVESQGVRVRRSGEIRLSVKSDVDWFELDGQIDFGGATASLPDLLGAVRRREQFVLLDDGTQGLLPQDWLAKYGHLADMADSEGDALRFAPSQALLLDALLAEQNSVSVDRKFTAFRDKLRNFAGVKPASEPRGFQGKLRDYQKVGLGWLRFLRDFRLGGCLADDMGLGKTVQVLAMLQSRRQRRLKQDEVRLPSIVVVPKSLVFNWIDEAARFAPRLAVLNYTGTDRKSRLEEAKFDILITTYGTLRRDIVGLMEYEFDYAILDESQAIKNANSQAAKACRLLNAEHRLAMTGTPVENHLGELWSLFEFLNPGMLGRSSAFDAVTRNGEGEDEALQQLATSLRPFMLRRVKEQVLKELPAKTEQTLVCEMSAKERKQYNELRDYYRLNLSNRVKEVGLKRSKVHVLEALLRLRQAACHPGLLSPAKKNELSPKLELLLDQVKEVVAEGHKALVFSQFTSFLAIAREHLDNCGISYAYLDGKTRRRDACVDQFQNDDDCQLFLISLKAGGHGLNLTAADYVFILDPWWNPAVEAQAIDRAHRIGQTRPVFAYRIICRDTVEDKILELQRSKRELADAIISADNSVIRNLSADDLQLLLS